MKFEFHGVSISVTHPDSNSALSEVSRRFAMGRGFSFATINLDHLVKLGRDNAFRTAYVTQDIVVADGHPIVWLSRLAGSGVGLVTGSDMVVPLVRAAAAANRPVAIIGSSLCALEAAVTNLTRDVPGVSIPLIVSPTYGFDPEGDEARAILARVAALGPCLCLVALGAPRQERFAALGRKLAPQAGFASVGAGIDFLSGIQKRAPVWLRRLALEWAWRMMSSPRRLVPRYLACMAILPVEIVAALRQRITGIGGRLLPDP